MRKFLVSEQVVHVVTTGLENVTAQMIFELCQRCKINSSKETPQVIRSKSGKVYVPHKLWRVRLQLRLYLKYNDVIFLQGWINMQKASRCLVTNF